MTHSTTTPFDASTVGVVDYCSTTGNLLIRGNMPLQQPNASGVSYFAYDQLNQAIDHTIGDLPSPPVSNFDLSNYFLIDVSLIDNQGDAVDLNSEFSCFSLKPSKTFAFLNGTNWKNAWPPYQDIEDWTPTNLLGTSVSSSATSSHLSNLVWWPVQACASSTNCNLEVSNKGYGFVGLIDYLSDLLTNDQSPNPSTPSSVIYVHCNSGVNRTGAANVAYFLKYGSSLYSGGQPMTLKSAYTQADSLGPKQLPGPDDEQLVQAYCNYTYSNPQSTTPTLSQCTYLPSNEVGKG